MNNRIFAIGIVAALALLALAVAAVSSVFFPGLKGEVGTQALWVAAVVVAALGLAVFFFELRLQGRVRELGRQVRLLSAQPKGDRCVDIRGRGHLAELAGAINVIVAEADDRAKDMEAMSGKISRMHRDLYELANTDPLTGLSNRRRFFEDLAQQLSQAGRYQHSLCIAVFDVDDFKSINDKHGFAAGDKVLRDLAAISRAALRDSDILARIGNEEFALVMPETQHGGAVALCERLRRDYEMRHVEHEGAEIRYLCSFGVTGFLPETDTADTLLGRGYEMLRLAKESGRNRVIAN